MYSHKLIEFLFSDTRMVCDGCGESKLIIYLEYDSYESPTIQRVSQAIVLINCMLSTCHKFVYVIVIKSEIINKSFYSVKAKF